MIVSLVLMLVFDWRVGIPLLLLFGIGFFLQGSLMGKDSMKFMQTYQDSLETMNHEAVEYIRGISVGSWPMPKSRQEWPPWRRKAYAFLFESTEWEWRSPLCSNIVENCDCPKPEQAAWRSNPAACLFARATLQEPYLPSVGECERIDRH